MIEWKAVLNYARASQQVLKYIASVEKSLVTLVESDSHCEKNPVSPEPTSAQCDVSPPLTHRSSLSLQPGSRYDIIINSPGLF